MSSVILTSDSLIGTPASGNLEYNGQFFGTDSNASRAQMQRITLGAVQATTSGTGPFYFTGIPAWVKRITVQFSGVSASASNLAVQIGSGSYSTSGYVGGGALMNSSGNTLVSTGNQLGFYGSVTLSTGTGNGTIVLTNITGNTWVGTVNASRSDGVSLVHNATITLGGVLDRLQVTTFTGTATFSAGQINILYEG
jgi:hypothetical protein